MGKIYLYVIPLYRGPMIIIKKGRFSFIRGYASREVITMGLTPKNTWGDRLSFRLIRGCRLEENLGYLLARTEQSRKATRRV